MLPPNGARIDVIIHAAQRGHSDPKLILHGTVEVIDDAEVLFARLAIRQRPASVERKQQHLWLDCMRDDRIIE
jgi:hypothetical protein